MSKIFKPHHISATDDDLAGNGEIGRYLILPGSSGRAKEIAKHFENTKVIGHQRGHDLYTGHLSYNGQKIDVATVASGMGCPSMEIILHELFHLGAKRFLRVGTTGTLQETWAPIGSLVNVQASVRDEDTSTHYSPIEVPAVASLEFVTSTLVAAQHLGIAESIHTGIVHTKSSFYAREFAAGPRAPENQTYMNLLMQSGVIASEMETSTLFIQSQVYNHSLMQQGEAPQHRVLAGAILAIIATLDHVENSPRTTQAIENSIQLALETIKILAVQEGVR